MRHEPVIEPIKETVNIPARKNNQQKTALPEDFKVSKRVQTWADKKGHTSLDEHLENFTLRHLTERSHQLLRSLPLFVLWPSMFLKRRKIASRFTGVLPSLFKTQSAKGTELQKIFDDLKSGKGYKQKAAQVDTDKIQSLFTSNKTDEARDMLMRVQAGMSMQTDPGRELLTSSVEIKNAVQSMATPLLSMTQTMRDGILKIADMTREDVRAGQKRIALSEQSYKRDTGLAALSDEFRFKDGRGRYHFRPNYSKSDYSAKEKAILDEFARQEAAYDKVNPDPDARWKKGLESKASSGIKGYAASVGSTKSLSLGNSALSDKKANFLKEWSSTADKVSVGTGISRKLLLSKWALESGWGKHIVGSNNIGNIKGAGTSANALEYANGNPYMERSSFRDYISKSDFAKDAISQYKRNWPEALGAQSRNEFIQGLKISEDGGYATDPKYGDKLGSVFDSMRLPASHLAAEQEKRLQVDISINGGMEQTDQAGNVVAKATIDPTSSSIKVSHPGGF